MSSNIVKKAKTDENILLTKMLDLKNIYAKNGHDALETALDAMIFDFISVEDAKNLALATLGGYNKGLIALGESEIDQLVEGEEIVDEYHFLRSIKHYEPPVKGVYDVTGTCVRDPIKGHWTFDEEELLNEIAKYEKRIKVMKFELNRRKTIVEKKICNTVITMAERKQIRRIPFDSQEMTDFY